MVTLAHDAGTGRSLVEVVLAVRTPFAVRARPSYLGKAAATLAEVGADVDLTRLGDALAQAHAAAYGCELVDLPSLVVPDEPADTDDPREDPPWAAALDEAIGVVGAGRDRAGRMRLGGELMISRDALAALEHELATGDAEPGAVGRAVDATLGAPRVALVGVKSLLSLRDVVVLARAAHELP
jgi:hypothetical protein